MPPPFASWQRAHHPAEDLRYTAVGRLVIEIDEYSVLPCISLPVLMIATAFHCCLTCGVEISKNMQS